MDKLAGGVPRRALGALLVSAMCLVVVLVIVDDPNNSLAHEEVVLSSERDATITMLEKHSVLSQAQVLQLESNCLAAKAYATVAADQVVGHTLQSLSSLREFLLGLANVKISAKGGVGTQCVLAYDRLVGELKQRWRKVDAEMTLLQNSPSEPSLY